MDEDLRHRRDTSLGQLEALIRRGRQIKNARTVDGTRAWQQDCAAAINQLSGGSKAHWLARAYSRAFLVRSADGRVIVEADATEIVDRILGVLAQGATSLSRMDDVAAASSGAAPRARQFEFVHNAALRPVLEQAFDDSRGAVERGESGLALILACGLIEAVLTDALDYAQLRTHDACGSARHESTASYGETSSAFAKSFGDTSPKPFAGEGGPGLPTVASAEARGPLADWSFETRIAAAERAGLIRGGCARLPQVALRYRDLTDVNGELRAEVPVSEREARLARQVLRVVMRDLDPGR